MAQHELKVLNWKESDVSYPAQVESAIRDGVGNVINTYYVPKSELSNYVLTTTLTSELAKYLALTGGTLTGTLVAPIIQTGSDTNNYFQCIKIRGQGDASNYSHAIDFGNDSHPQVDFYEYGGVYNFWKNTSSTITSDASNKVASLQLGKLVERGNTLTYPGKSGTLATTDDIKNSLSGSVTNKTLTITLE